MRRQSSQIPPTAPATQLGCIGRKVEVHPPQAFCEEEKLRNEPFLSAGLVSCWLLESPEPEHVFSPPARYPNNLTKAGWRSPGHTARSLDFPFRPCPRDAGNEYPTPFLLFLLAKHPLWSPPSPTDGLVQPFRMLEQDRSRHNSVCSILATV